MLGNPWSRRRRRGRGYSTIPGRWRRSRRDSAIWLERQSSDAIVAAAQHALLDASTERTAAILLDQARGALRRCVEQIISRLQCGDSPSATSLLNRLLQLTKVGLHLTQPWRVAIAGPPNAGKSSLMNRLLGYERTIVFEQPGTTRDSVTALTALDGWPIEASDTAGLRVPGDAIEAEGVNRARSQVQTADLVLLVDDRSAPAVPDDLWLARTACVLRVANKSDLAAHPSHADRNPSFLVSARTGDGVPQLSRAITQRLINPPPLPGEAVPFTAAQTDSLHRAWSLVRQGQAAAAARATERPYPGLFRTWDMFPNLNPDRSSTCPT